MVSFYAEKGVEREVDGTGDFYNEDRKSSLKQAVILNYKSINRIQVSEYYSNF